MTVLRSTLFNILYGLWSIGLAIALVPVLLAPRAWAQAGARVWTRGILLLARMIIGLRHEVRGREHLAPGAAIVASKHQSAWETFAFHTLVDDPAYVLKRELFFIPFIGWQMRKTGMIGIDRSKGASALKAMVRGAAALADERQVVVFPEGTRTAPGTDNPYHPGIAAIYHASGLPVVPVALNSGVFWGRRSYSKRGGVIVVEFLPPIPAGLDRRTFLATLKARIDEATARLVAEATTHHVAEATAHHVAEATAGDPPRPE